MRHHVHHHELSTVATIGMIGAANASIPCRLRAAARRLRVELRALPLDTGDLLGAVATCDTVTFDPDTITPDVLDRLDETGIAVRPNPRVARLVVEFEAASDMLRRCGFDVDAPTPSRFPSSRPPARPDSAAFRVLVLRRPSGTSAVRVRGDDRPRLDPHGHRARAIADAVALADGLDSVGALHIDFVSHHDGSRITGLEHGCGRRALATMSDADLENHLRALLDWPLDRPPTRHQRRAVLR